MPKKRLIRPIEKVKDKDENKDEQIYELTKKDKYIVFKFVFLLFGFAFGVYTTFFVSHKYVSPRIDDTPIYQKIKNVSSQKDNIITMMPNYLNMSSSSSIFATQPAFLKEKIEKEAKNTVQNVASNSANMIMDEIYKQTVGKVFEEMIKNVPQERRKAVLENLEK